MAYFESIIRAFNVARTLTLAKLSNGIQLIVINKVFYWLVNKK